MWTVIPQVTIPSKTLVLLETADQPVALRVSDCPVTGCLGWGSTRNKKATHHRTRESCPIVLHMDRRRDHPGLFEKPIVLRTPTDQGQAQRPSPTPTPSPIQDQPFQAPLFANPQVCASIYHPAQLPTNFFPQGPVPIKLFPPPPPPALSPEVLKALIQNLIKTPTPSPKQPPPPLFFINSNVGVTRHEGMEMKDPKKKEEEENTAYY